MTKRLLFALAILSVLVPIVPAAAQAPNQEPPPCIKQFLVLRADAETKAKALQAASKRQATPQEACGLFNAFVRAEEKVVKYAGDNTVWCGIPPNIVQQMKANHAKARTARTRVCQAAAQPVRPAGPTLGEALGTTPVPDASNTKRGHGIFDTLTGSPLGR
jgi:hypothetical protein